MILSDTEIVDRCGGDNPMISPFEVGLVTYEQREDHSLPKKVISYGLSSYGYDIRLADEFRVFTNTYNAIVDPKDLTTHTFVERFADEITIPPNSFALGRSFEHIIVPRDVLVLCIGKSTYARCGIVVNVTPLEPEWRGHITIEISNTTPLPAKIYAYEGICQLLFLKASTTCIRSYADRKGKYQNQTGITLPRV